MHERFINFLLNNIAQFEYTKNSHKSSLYLYDKIIMFEDFFSFLPSYYHHTHYYYCTFSISCVCEVGEKFKCFWHVPMLNMKLLKQKVEEKNQFLYVLRNWEKFQNLKKNEFKILIVTVFRIHHDDEL